jgi:DNA-binding MarR family transcriptional regulator
MELAFLMQTDMENGLQALGLTRARATVMWQLHYGGPTTQRVLSDALKVTPRNVTGLVDALEADGFVVRTKHPTDRRATHDKLTDRGTTTTASMEAGAGEFADQLFGHLSEDELRTFVGTLDGVVGRLRQVVAAQGL